MTESSASPSGPPAGELQQSESAAGGAAKEKRPFWRSSRGSLPPADPHERAAARRRTDQSIHEFTDAVFAVTSDLEQATRTAAARTQHRNYPHYTHRDG